MPPTPTLKSMAANGQSPREPARALTAFLEAEEKYEKARVIEKMRFVGYVLELGYEAARIITSDPYKLAVEGIPRGRS